MLAKKTLVLFSYLRAEDLMTDLTVRSNPPDSLGDFKVKETQRLYPDLSQLQEISALPNNATSTIKRKDGGTISDYEAFKFDMEEILPNMTEEEGLRLIKRFEVGFPQLCTEKAHVKGERIAHNEQPLGEEIFSNNIENVERLIDVPKDEEYSCENIKNSIIGYLKSVANHAFLLGCKIYLKVDQFLNYFSAKKIE